MTRQKNPTSGKMSWTDPQTLHLSHQILSLTMPHGMKSDCVSSAWALGQRLSPSPPCSGKRGPQSEETITSCMHCTLVHITVTKKQKLASGSTHTSSSFLAFVRTVHCILQHCWNQWLQVFQYCRHRLRGWKENVFLVSATLVLPVNVRFLHSPHPPPRLIVFLSVLSYFIFIYHFLLYKYLTFC